MVYDFILCQSLTYAQRAVVALGRAGIAAYIMRVPQSLSTNGCGYGVKVPQRRLAAALHVLSESGIPPGRVYRIGPDGGYQEVRL